MTVSSEEDSGPGTLRAALESGDRRATEREASRLVAAIVAMLEVEPVRIRVLATRPRSATSELHGLYSFEEGETAQIQVWMKTAAHKRIVAFRTFLRTLIHELCHHLDYNLYDLEDSFHTEGFFRRESSIVRQLLPKTPRRSSPKRDATQAASTGDARHATSAKTAAKRASGRRGRTRQAAQMDLPFAE